MLPSRRKSAWLVVERLEDRCTPATFGNAWPDASHLTLSLTPDGTSVGPRTSNLFQTLNALAPTKVWQREVFRAFQTWAAVANVNFGVVADGGQDVGSDGLVQGDSRFGDIRLASYAMAADVEGVASPFEPVGGTWSGDIKLNAATSMSIGGKGGADLFTVVLHEVGHSLGLDHSDDPASVMYESYVGPRVGLSAADIAAVRALYGARLADANEGRGGNDTFVSATNVGLVTTAGVTGGTTSGDLATTADTDFYKFTVPLSVSGLVVRVQTLGLSLLAPRVTVYDAARRVVAAVASPGPNGGNLEIKLARLQLLSTYYVKVEGATSDVFSIGGYRLAVDSLPGVTGIVQSTGGLLADASTLLNVDLHTNDSILTASLLPQTFATANSRFDYAYRGSISDTRDVDFYKFKAPATDGSGSVLTVMAWGLVTDGLKPNVSVWDARGEKVAADVLVNANSSYTIQVPGAVADAAYFVKIHAAQPAGSNAVGNYFLGVDFSPNAVQLQSIAAGTLTEVAHQAFNDLDVKRTVLQHFVLAADTRGSSIAAAIRMTIYDECDRIVHTMVANAGDTVSADVLLGPGKYRIRFAAGTANPAQALPDLSYVLRGIELDDPMGPQPSDTTTAPTGGTSGTPPNTTSSSTAPDSSSSTTTSKTTYTTTTPSDPYSDPYSGS